MAMPREGKLNRVFRGGPGEPTPAPVAWAMTPERGERRCGECRREKLDDMIPVLEYLSIL